MTHEQDEATRSSHVTVSHVFVFIAAGYIAAVFSRSDHLKKWKLDRIKIEIISHVLTEVSGLLPTALLYYCALFH